MSKKMFTKDLNYVIQVLKELLEESSDQTLDDKLLAHISTYPVPFLLDILMVVSQSFDDVVSLDDLSPKVRNESNTEHDQLIDIIDLSSYTRCSKFNLSILVINTLLNKSTDGRVDPVLDFCMWCSNVQLELFKDFSKDKLGMDLYMVEWFKIVERMYSPQKLEDKCHAIKLLYGPELEGRVDTIKKEKGFELFWTDLFYYEHLILHKHGDVYAFLPTIFLSLLNFDVAEALYWNEDDQTLVLGYKERVILRIPMNNINFVKMCLQNDFHTKSLNIFRTKTNFSLTEFLFVLHELYVDEHIGFSFSNRLLFDAFNQLNQQRPNQDIGGFIFNENVADGAINLVGNDLEQNLLAQPTGNDTALDAESVRNARYKAQITNIYVPFILHMLDDTKSKCTVKNDEDRFKCSLLGLNIDIQDGVSIFDLKEVLFASLLFLLESLQSRSFWYDWNKKFKTVENACKKVNVIDIEETEIFDTIKQTSYPIIELLLERLFQLCNQDKKEFLQLFNIKKTSKFDTFVKTTFALHLYHLEGKIDPPRRGTKAVKLNKWTISEFSKDVGDLVEQFESFAWCFDADIPSVRCLISNLETSYKENNMNDYALMIINSLARNVVPLPRLRTKRNAVEKWLPKVQKAVARVFEPFEQFWMPVLDYL